MGRKILVILGHPRSESLCGALSRAYIEGAEAAGHTVSQLELGALSFDPILRESVRGDAAPRAGPRASAGADHLGRASRLRLSDLVGRDAGTAQGVCRSLPAARLCLSLPFS